MQAEVQVGGHVVAGFIGVVSARLGGWPSGVRSTNVVWLEGGGEEGSLSFVLSLLVVR